MKEKANKKPSKLKLGLIMKISGIVLLPVLVIIIVSALSLRNVALTVSENMAEHELNMAVFSANSELELISSEEYIYNASEDKLYKGDVCLSEMEDVFDPFREETDIETTFIIGDERILTTILNEKGERAVHTKIDAAVYDEVVKTGSCFVPSVMIQGIEHEGYYELIDDSETGKEIILFAGIRSDIAKESYAGFMRSSIIFVVIIAVIGLAIIMAVLYFIVKSINLAIHNLDKVADGELNFAVTQKILNRTDEVGNMARSVQTLIRNLAATITNILSSSNSLNDFSDKFQDNFKSINNSISNVNIAVEEIANGATNQANETQNVNTQINDMGDAIDATTNNIATLTTSTDTMKQHNKQVQTTLEELINISNRTKDSIDEVHNQTNVTNKSAAEIGEAVNIITDIASQTNLLSLNASIEAARAGEHGRGFAVVADEIRQLADQSSESAERISQIVAELVRNSNTSVNTMNVVLSDINDQFEKLNATQRVFYNLNEEINNVAVAIDTISEEVDSINTVKNEVLGSVESLAAIAEENAASTEETSAAMFELGQIVNECNESTQELVTLSGEMAENANKFKL